MRKSAKKPRPRKDSAVGYGKPPQQHRFKPGKSGNPRGRPKSLPELSDLTAKELRRRGHVMIDGKRVAVTRMQLLVKQLIASAGKGNAKPLAFLLEMLAKNEAKERKKALLEQGTTVHAGMTPKEAMDEYTRWFKEVCSQPIFDT